MNRRGKSGRLPWAYDNTGCSLGNKSRYNDTETAEGGNALGGHLVPVENVGGEDGRHGGLVVLKDGGERREVAHEGQAVGLLDAHKRVAHAIDDTGEHVLVAGEHVVVDLP